MICIQIHEMRSGNIMPIKIPDYLPAKEVLNQENIFVMDESRAYRQDIRPLRIAISYNFV